MSDGAFALFIDQPAGLGPGKSGRRVIPIPRADEVKLSLAFDDFGGPPVANTATATVRIIDNNGNVQQQSVTIKRGRSTFIPLGQNDRAVSVLTSPIGTSPNDTLPAVTALVEFTT